MKKLWLTACAAAFVGFACMAQEQQDSTKNQSNQYRNTPQRSDSTDAVQGKKSTRIHMQTDNSDSLQNERPQTSGEHLGNEINEIDSAATDSVNNTGDRMQQSRQQMDRNRSSIRQDVDSARQDVDSTKDQMQNDASRTRDQLQNDVDQTKQDLKNEGERTGNRLKSDAERMRDEGDDDATRRNDNMRRDSTGSSSTNNNGNQMAMSSSKMDEPLEVVPDKEGPNNEVVYKFQGDMYYVDRGKQELVKAKESDLKDSKTELMIHEGQPTKDVAKRGKRSGRS